MFMQINTTFFVGKNQSQALISLNSTNCKDLTNSLLLPFWKHFNFQVKRTSECQNMANPCRTRKNVSISVKNILNNSWLK